MDDTSLLQLPNDPAALKQLLLAERFAYAIARLELQSGIDQREKTIVDRDKRLAEREESIRLLSEDNSLLRHRLSQLLRSSYGPRAERFDPRQLLLFGLRVPPLDEQAPDGSSQESGEKSKSANRSRHGRRKLPEHLPRIAVEHDLSEQEKPCPCCGEQRHRIGQETAEQLEYLPGNFLVLQHVRPKYACRHCNSGECQQCDGHAHIDRADKPAEGIERCLAGPGLLAYVITSKLADHCVQGEAVSQMREGLSRPGDRARPQTSPNCGGQEPSWETSGANGATRSRQVRSAKSNASEPLMMCRNSISLTPKPGSGDCSGISMGGACNPAHVASGIKAARARIRLGHGTLEPVALMPREKPKRTTREGESTDARHRGGTTRSSVEGRVTRLERRGRVIQSLDNRSTVSTGGAYG